jgi:hypothetical protein
MSTINELHGTADHHFRAAFERLKLGATVNLPKGSAVSQNNVAKEAGRDPSALRKSRHPELIQEIQRWVARQDSPRSSRRQVEAARSTSKRLREGHVVLKAQLDCLASELLAARALVIELSQENHRLRAQLGLDNVSRLSIKGPSPAA